VGVGLDAAAQYPPPVFTGKETSLNPPQTIISLSVHTAVCTPRASGAFVVLVAVQVSVPESYLPPVFTGKETSLNPPQTIISLPVKTAV
jgi:hypothetical protein